MSLILSGTDGVSDIDGTVSTPAIRGTDTNTGIFFPTADTIAFTEGGVESMRINASGQVAIGSTSPVLPGGSPTTRGEVSINGSTDSFVAFGIGGVIKGYVGQTSNGLQLDSEGATTITAVTNGSERMRIDSSGNVLVGATSAATPTGVTSKFVSQGNFTVSTFGAAISSTAATGVDHYYISFQTATTTQRGYIYYNNGAGQVQLSATSDIRLKENIVDAPLALPILEQVKVRQYDWKETGNTNVGFVAQELYDVIPRAVAVGEDNEDGSIKRVWGVDNGTLVPYLVKAIQELKAELDSVKAELQTLKGT